MKQETNFNYNSILFQIVVALIFSLLNLAISCATGATKIPLFMDMPFIYAASFFGWPAGILCSIFFRLFDYLVNFQLPTNLPYIICMFTGVIIVRVCMKKFQGKLVLTLLLISLLSAIIISIEGGIISSILFSNLNISDSPVPVFLTAQLLMANVPLLFSSILARIPINLADKLLSVFIGYAAYVGVKMILAKFNLSGGTV